MEKTLTIDGKKVPFKTNGALPLRYKAQFGKDFFKEIIKMAPLAKMQDVTEMTPEVHEMIDFEIFYNVAWLMAKTADSTIPEPMEWLSSFEEFPITDLFVDLQELMLATLSSSKKKMPTTKKVKKK